MDVMLLLRKYVFVSREFFISLYFLCHISELDGLIITVCHSQDDHHPSLQDQMSLLCCIFCLLI